MKGRLRLTLAINDLDCTIDIIHYLNIENCHEKGKH